MTQKTEAQPEAGIDPTMDAALSWLFELQAAPQDDARAADFARWRAADPAHAAAFDAVAAAWALPEMDLVAAGLRSAAAPGPDEATRAALAARPGRRPARPATPAAPRRKRRALALGGLAAAALLLAIGLPQLPRLSLLWRADYRTATGAEQSVILPDGSRMVLNTDSAVALDFAAGRREVALLRGEAYFDVRHDPAHPFRVTAAHAEVEVRGTAFAVRTEADADSVLLARGRVEVTLLPGAAGAGTAPHAALAPGEAIRAGAAALSPVRPADPATELAWLEGRLVFTDRPLADLLQEIGRYYRPAVLLADPRLGAVRLSGSYRLDDPARVIRSLAIAAGGHATRLPGGVIILN